mmetsp:Transcript_21343/g.55679  ORF Transcript_21343/g.55679 Transcript_21343/m.55679 type:complete len:290 (-) Transcript_21343:78-947(-)
MGTEWSVCGEMTTTLGSSPRNAERRNLKPASDTKRSVHALTVDLRSCSGVFSPPPCFPGERLPARAAMDSGVALMTMSTSGTATPKALPLERLAPTKPVTSAPGSSGCTALFTAQAISATASVVSVVGVSCRSSSSTSASHPWPLNVGACTGTALGFQVSAFCCGSAGARSAAFAEGLRRCCLSGPWGEAGWAKAPLRPLPGFPLGAGLRSRSTLGCSACASRNPTTPTSSEITCEVDSGRKEHTVAAATTERLRASPRSFSSPRKGVWVAGTQAMAAWIEGVWKVSMR